MTSSSQKIKLLFNKRRRLKREQKLSWRQGAFLFLLAGGNTVSPPLPTPLLHNANHFLLFPSPLLVLLLLPPASKRSCQGPSKSKKGLHMIHTMKESIHTLLQILYYVRWLWWWKKNHLKNMHFSSSSSLRLLPPLLNIKHFVYIFYIN